MVTFNTVCIDGLVIRSGWDPYHAGPVELHITIDSNVYPSGKGIPERVVRRLSLQSMSPESMRTSGSLRVVGDWLDKNKPVLRTRPMDPEVWYAHIALFFVLAVQEGERGVAQVLANHAGVRPSRAREWVEIARRLDMLTDNPAGCSTGRAFGVLTDKARAVLASHSQSQSLGHEEAA